MLALAEHILETKAAKFDPTKFHDRYEAAIVAMLEEKKAGMPVSTKRELPKIVAGTDLMSALRQSIERAKAEGQSPTAQVAAKPAGSGKGKKAAKQNRDQRALLLPIDGGAAPKKAAEKQPQKTGTRKKAG
jgi:DNA end-binding protein Ku